MIQKKNQKKLNIQVDVAPSKVNVDYVQELIKYVSEPFILENIKDVPAEIEKCCDILRQIPNHPLSMMVWVNLGLLREKIGDADMARKAYEAALEKKPDFAPAIVNNAILFEKLGKTDEALELLGRRVNPLGWETTTLNQRGRIYEILGRLKESETVLLQSLLLDPKQTDVLHHYTHLRAKQCRWPVLVNMPDLPVEYQKRHMGCLGIQSYTDDPKFQFESIVDWVKHKYTQEVQSYLAKPRQSHSRIRLGILSSDLRWHAVSILAVEFFESLDKSVFEVFAFDFSPRDNTAFSQRVLSSFEHLKPIHQMTDHQAAQLIADCEIDILLDLNGLTANARPEILKCKPAHIQISWLGSLTTTGVKEVDYLLTDEYVFQEDNKPYFTEKPLMLKTGMHLNDSKREVGVTKTRAEYGLPEDKFIYCCFNNNYKITEQVFDIWLEILKGSENTVLWLLADNEWSKENLLARALSSGIAVDRIIFAGRILPMDYLARFKAADLFLDTSPYNAGTTAIDCLFVGLPILTCPGKSVSSRVAAGVLWHANCPSLIAKDWSDYQKIAIELSQEPVRLKAIREYLNSPEKMQSPLFNTQGKVKDFEQALVCVWDEYVASNKPKEEVLS